MGRRIWALWGYLRASLGGEHSSPLFPAPGAPVREPGSFPGEVSQEPLRNLISLVSSPRVWVTVDQKLVGFTLTLGGLKPGEKG